MDTWIKFGLLVIAAYLLGSVPTSYLAARSRGVDMRKQGTGQVGAGNLWRTTSRKLGFTIGIFDFLKGMLMVWIARLAGLDTGQQLMVGLAVIVGHNWPVFLRFHGGRGIATLLGIVIILPALNDISSWPSFIAIGFVAVIAVVLRTTPISVLLSAASLPLTSWIFHAKVAIIMAYLAIFVVIVIKRLIAQPSNEKRQIGMGYLLLNRLLYDRDIRDRAAWVHRKQPPKKETQE